jgi:mercuric ion binding protein
MNFTKSIATLALTTLLFVSCKKTEEAPKETAATETVTPKVKKAIAAENLQTANFSVEGMTCEFGCAKTIQKELSNLDGVETATIDFEKKIGIVTFDKTIQTPETLAKVVQATGDGKTYTVSNMKS